MVGNRVIVWDKNAFEHFKEAFGDLKETKNLSYATKFRNKILKSVSELLDNPELYERDRFRIDNDGSYRAFENFNFRITYKITETQIKILRVRHSSREPVEY